MTLLLALAATSLGADYQRCPGHELLATAADVSWTPGLTAIAKHRELRATWHRTLPEAPTRILWWASGGDLATVSFSVVATRRSDGIRHTSGVGQTQNWIKDASPIPTPPMERDLSPARSAALDAASRDRCRTTGRPFSTIATPWRVDSLSR